MPKATVNRDWFNSEAELPYSLRISDFDRAMQDVYDFFADVNDLLLSKHLERLDDMLRPANMTGTISDMLTASMARGSRGLVTNRWFNGHPDLIPQNEYPDDAVKAGDQGVEIKSTRKAGGAVDTHGARDQWMCVFVYQVDNLTQPAKDRAPMSFTDVFLGQVTEADFRKNPRGERGTRTATLDEDGIAKLRAKWVYRIPREPKPVRVPRAKGPKRTKPATAAAEPPVDSTAQAKTRKPKVVKAR